MACRGRLFLGKTTGATGPLGAVCQGIYNMCESTADKSHCTLSRLPSPWCKVPALGFLLNSLSGIASITKKLKFIQRITLSAVAPGWAIYAKSLQRMYKYQEYCRLLLCPLTKASVLIVQEISQLSQTVMPDPSCI